MLCQRGINQLPHGDAPVARARELVLEYGWNATAYQIINPGITHWFAAGNDAVIGYVLRCGVRVVAGAPVCALERLPAVVAEFEHQARRAGERVCYFGAEARMEQLCAGDTARSMVLLGAQPAWQPAHWAGIISTRASLRAQLARARNKDVRVTEWATERATGNAELRRCLAEWLATRGLPPLHFLIEPQTLQRLFDRRVFVAQRGNSVVGFLVASPVPTRSGWLVEQNVRGHSAPNGTAELMIDTAVRAMNADAADYVTLGLAPLSRRAGLPTLDNPFPIRATLAWVRAHGRRFYNFDGLDAFKTKFKPDRWEPVYAIANEPRFRMATLYAIAMAFTNGAPVSTIARGVARGFGRRTARQQPSHPG